MRHIIQPETNPQFDIVEIVLVSFFHIILGPDKIGSFSSSRSILNSDVGNVSLLLKTLCAAKRMKT